MNAALNHARELSDENLEVRQALEELRRERAGHANHSKQHEMESEELAEGRQVLGLEVTVQEAPGAANAEIEQALDQKLQREHAKDAKDAKRYKENYVVWVKKYQDLWHAHKGLKKQYEVSIRKHNEELGKQDKTLSRVKADAAMAIETMTRRHVAEKEAMQKERGLTQRA